MQGEEASIVVQTQR